MTPAGATELQRRIHLKFSALSLCPPRDLRDPDLTAWFSTMSPLCRIPCLLALATLSALTFFAAEAPPSVDPFHSLPNVRQPRVSPDGTKIAFLFPHEKRMTLG